LEHRKPMVSTNCSFQDFLHFFPVPMILTLHLGDPRNRIKQHS
jgi:hypothetical protein